MQNTILRKQLTSCTKTLFLAYLISNGSVIAAESVPVAKVIGETTLEEIVVTASKRETKLLKTPIAITALSQAALEAKGIQTARDLGSNVPNLQIGATPDSGAFFSLRGISSTDSTEVAEASVALHLDGFYSPRPQSALALIYDVERVEVLRGPQGTLFGQNSPGGTINIIPAKPVFGEYSGKAEIQFGNYNTKQVRAAINLGITSRLAVRISGFLDRHDGFLNQVQDFTDAFYTPPAKLLSEVGPDGPLPNVVTIVKDGIPDVDQRRNKPVKRKNWYNNAQNGGARAIIRWNPIDAIETSVLISHFQDNGAGDVSLTDCGQAAGTVNACDHPLRYAKINVPGDLHLKIETYQLKLIGHLNDHMVIEYRGGIQEERRSQRSDLDAGAHPSAAWSSIGNPGPLNFADGSLNPAAVTNYYVVADDSSYTRSSRYFSHTQELQLKSTGSGSFQYVFGAFLLHEAKRIQYDVDSIESKSYGITAAGLLQPDGLPYAQRYDQQNRTTTSHALFAQADWRILPKLGLTAGYRHNWDKKGDYNGYTYLTADDRNQWYNGLYTPVAGAIRAHQSNDLLNLPNLGTDAPLGTTVPLVPSPGNPTHDTKKWSSGTFRLGAQYYANDATMLYASVSTGYKMGGFFEQADVCNHGCYEPLVYNPEFVTSYELGYKGKLFNNKLQFTLAAFYANYRDIQQSGDFVVGSQTFKTNLDGTPNANFGKPVTAYTTVNLAKAKIKGVEFEFTAIPWEHGTLSGFATYLNAKVSGSGAYTDAYARDARLIYGQTPLDITDDSGAVTKAFGTTSLVGKKLPYAPDFSISLNYRHDFDIPGDIKISPYISGKYQSKMWLDILNYDGPHLAQYQKAYAKLDANLRISTHNDKYFAEFYVENLTDIATKGFDSYTYGSVSAYYDQPRTWGLRLGGEF